MFDWRRCLTKCRPCIALSRCLAGQMLRSRRQLRRQRLSERLQLRWQLSSCCGAWAEHRPIVFRCFYWPIISSMCLPHSWITSPTAANSTAGNKTSRFLNSTMARLLHHQDPGHLPGAFRVGFRGSTVTAELVRTRPPGPLGSLRALRS